MKRQPFQSTVISNRGSQVFEALTYISLYQPWVKRGRSQVHLRSSGSKGENWWVPTGVGLRGVNGNALGTVVGESL